MTPAFRDWIESARVSVNDILSARHIDLPGRGNRRAGPCPKCGGDDRFAVDLDKQLFNCRGCGGKGHGAISLVRFLDESSFLQAVETINGTPPPKDEAKPAARKRTARGRFVCAYDYTDELDVVRYRVCRYADPKSFSQQQPDPDRPGEWIENLNGVRLVPYRLPDLIEGIAYGRLVYVVEGEKDADAGAALGLTITTTAMGLAGKGHWERGVYDEFFAGADVVLVPDQDDDPRKGREFARVIGKRLKAVAERVRLLSLPAKDLSDWLDQGGTREVLDELPLGELPATNGHDPHHGENGQPWEPVGTIETPKSIEPVPTIVPFPIDGKTIPRRPWLVPGLLLRRHVSVLVAPPGSGKSLLTLQMALMMGTAMKWGGWRPRKVFKTLIINSEDDIDEMRRRLYAGAKEMGCDEEQLREQIELADRPENIIIARSDAKTKTVIRTPMVENIIATIVAGGFDCVILDPFAECFSGDENSNSELKWAALLWREIAQRTNAAVLLVHHTRKYANEPGDMDAARGAGALLGVARVVSTVFTMSEQEAQAFEIGTDRRHEYLRFDDAKANLSLVTFKARWFFKKTFTLPNEGDSEPADDVGVLVPWTPPNVFDKLDVAMARAILLAIDFGVLNESGAPTGDLYTLYTKGGGKRWAGTVVQDHISGTTKQDAQKVLDAWHRNGVLIEIERETSTSKGQPRKGLKVDMSHLPGTTSDEASL